MAKRFTDTEKWRDEWWGSLSNDYRIIWLYLIDSCSHAGIWKKDFRGLNFNCNTKITEEEFVGVFGDRVIDKGNFFFIPKFLRFQYPKGLNSSKPVIVSVIKELSFYNLIQTVVESLGNDFLIVKDKDKEKDKDKDKDKEKTKTFGKSENLLHPEPLLEPTPVSKTINLEVPRQKEDELFSDYEAWTDQIIANNDQHFEQMLITEGIKPNGQLTQLARDHLGLLARYPKSRPPDQVKFRYSLLKHIRENLTKPKPHDDPKGTSRTTGAIIDRNKDFSNAKL